MENFKFSYNKENDDLFVYLEGARSKGGVELGNFVFDFDKNENLVAFQIFGASKVLKQLLTKIEEISKIKEFKADVINFRNMATIKINVATDEESDSANIIIPQIRGEKSPAISY
ncbi:DUF2283 domain-containing protein [Candidatus Pacearchaeota archaeon]|nr:DUF2283 domain-containing protein [Candidatus Pacearchaeota archaeon]